MRKCCPRRKFSCHFSSKNVILINYSNILNYFCTQFLELFSRAYQKQRFNWNVSENYYSTARHTVATRQSFWLVCNNFLTSFWQLSVGFRCIWPIKMQGHWEVELSFVGKPSWRLTTPTLTVLVFWLVSFSGSQQKIVKKLSKTNENLCPSANGITHSTVITVKLKLKETNYPQI